MDIVAMMVIFGSWFNYGRLNQMYKEKKEILVSEIFLKLVLKQEVFK